MARQETGRPSFRGKVPFEETGLPEYKFFIGPFKLVYNQGLFSAIREFDPDLVILQGIAGDLSNRRVISWARRKGKRIILWTCGWEPGLARGRLLALKNHFVSTYFRKAHIHLTYSNKASKYTEGMEFLLTGSPPVTMASNWMNCLQGSQRCRAVQGHYKRVWIGGEGHLPLCRGLIPEKKLDLLLDAFVILGRDIVKSGC